ncbi:hypothetical protein HF086_011778 [Spodoptera exigua]|uniref:Uncharacterized protein n=1 Tax=Spodoptera exigua TaxID=7107 RepID=A0A922M315_SPOEX|nr:hypothetical protein HF086_011778 [Spodoptera exigua]
MKLGFVLRPNIMLALSRQNRQQLNNYGADVSMVAPALIVGIDNAIDSDLVEESSQSQIPDAIEIDEHYVIDDVSQTSVISHDQATEDHNVLPDSPIPSTSQMSQPFITTIPSAKSHLHILTLEQDSKIV